MSFWIGELSARAPVLLFIDDIHWADSGTLALLRYLARRSSHLRLLILASYREIELDETGMLKTVLNDLKCINRQDAFRPSLDFH